MAQMSEKSINELESKLSVLVNKEYLSVKERLSLTHI